MALAILGGVAVLVGVAIVVGNHFERKRREAVRGVLAARGLAEAEQGLTPTPMVAALAPVERLVSRAERTVWAAEGRVDGVEAVVLEHHYTTGSGKSRQTHNHSVVSLPVPGSWPRLDVSAENIFHKIGEMFGSSDIKVEDEGFNKRFRVTGENEDFAVLFLSPEVQRMLLEWDRSMVVAVRAGRLCVYRSGHLKADAWDALIGRALALRRALAPELEAWGAGVG